jgi:hypothetical protein
MQVPELKQGRGSAAGTKALAKLRMKGAEQAGVAQKPRLLRQLIVGIDKEGQRSVLQECVVAVFGQVPSSEGSTA